MENSIIQIIKERYSCRKYLERPIADDTRDRLKDFLAAHGTGPLGSHTRLALIAATAEDKQSLKGLRTYGVIRGAQGFIVGAMGPGLKNLEDFGYLMEHAILIATDLGLGTCWLGGTFSKSSFSRKMNVTEEETVPAVTSIGYIADQSKTRSIKRLPPDQLFFQATFNNPLPYHLAGSYTQVLESVRYAPSASNKQPWRIIQSGVNWHFYLQRTKGYGKDSFLGKIIGVSDLQRVDMGIAMCHFELAARELGLSGHWELTEPDIKKPDGLTEYTASWITEP